MTKTLEEDRLRRLATAKKWYAANKERASATNATRYAENTERYKAYAAQYRQANPERIKAQGTAWRAANPVRQRELTKAWHLAHPGKTVAYAMERWCAELQRAPAWRNTQQIDAVYAEAAYQRSLGENVVVDHIIPLRGKFVSGLHVHNNLQVITAQANSAKSNTWVIE